MAIEDEAANSNTYIENWACTNCGSLNHQRSKICWKCGSVRDAQISTNLSAPEIFTPISRQSRIRSYVERGKKLYLWGFLVALILGIVIALPRSLFGIVNQSEWLKMKEIRTQEQWLADNGILNERDWIDQGSWWRYNQECGGPLNDLDRAFCAQVAGLIDNEWQDSEDYKAGQKFYQSQDYFEAQKWDGSIEKSTYVTFESINNWTLANSLT